MGALAPHRSAPLIASSASMHTRSCAVGLLTARSRGQAGPGARRAAALPRRRHGASEEIDDGALHITPWNF